MKFIQFMTIILIAQGCKGQSSPSNNATILIGGPCEGCEAIHEYGNKDLTSTATLPGYGENEPRLHIEGTIFHGDGTPAKDVILYIYHTNSDGIYETKGDEKGWARRHGFIRGWIKTGSDGTYRIHTFRPGAYPGRSEPEHIHLTVKEPGINEYYIDDILFDDDPLLTQEKRKTLLNRGGSGLVLPIEKNGILTIRRDIVLGKNIPGYR